MRQVMPHRNNIGVESRLARAFLVGYVGPGPHDLMRMIRLRPALSSAREYLQLNQLTTSSVPVQRSSSRNRRG
jgi:hypothetical protein